MRTNVATRVQKHRAGLRTSGLRPVQIWVPDTRNIDFVNECHRQSLTLRGDSQDTDAFNWLGTSADIAGWE